MSSNSRSLPIVLKTYLLAFLAFQDSLVDPDCTCFHPIHYVNLQCPALHTIQQYGPYVTFCVCPSMSRSLWRPFILSAIRTVSSAFLILLIHVSFTLMTNYSAEASWKIYSELMFNRSGERTHPCLTPLRIFCAFVTSLSNCS